MNAARRADLLMVGNAYNAQMPEFAERTRRRRSWRVLQALLAADAAGALLAGILLESWAGLRAHPSDSHGPRQSHGVCPCSHSQRRGLTAGDRVAVCRGVLRAVVQHDGTGPGPIECAHRHPRPRCRPVRTWPARPGMRAFSGVTVGVLGAGVGIHGRSACRPPCCWLFCSSCTAARMETHLIAVSRHSLRRQGLRRGRRDAAGGSTSRRSARDHETQA